jgi:DNA-directed RNA polymerase subunit E'/Rpb7
MKIKLLITEVGNNIKQNLEKKISAKIEGKCIAEGFIKPNSVNIVTYSSGKIINEYVEFETAFECMVCYPVEGMLIECEVTTISKAGIHAEVVDSDDVKPITVFVSRDHHSINTNFNKIEEKSKIIVSVVGTRFELNDPYICVIAKLSDFGKSSRNEYTNISGGGSGTPYNSKKIKIHDVL